ncbi:MAG: DUF3160 domain-containing protein [Fidelibacterota bacterium]
MKSFAPLLWSLFWLSFPATLPAQSNFNFEDYTQFLIENRDISAQELLERFTPEDPYYSRVPADTSPGEFAYLDSVMTLYDLTPDEKAILVDHRFVVSERLSFGSFGVAFHDIYGKDLPVFLSTDAILQALHRSYDQILMDLETAILSQRLQALLDVMNSTFSQLLTFYGDEPLMGEPLADVDLYITMARSLLAGEKLRPQFADDEEFTTLWDAVESEQMVFMPLFTENPRYLDFSQFTVRGHYTQSDLLGRYFRSMMWLGRMDFLLSPAPGLGLTDNEIRRMTMDAVLMVELLNASEGWEYLNDMEDVIRFMVGESDNLTPYELAEVMNGQEIEKGGALLDDETYALFREALTSMPGSGQRILSDIFLVDPFSTEPVPLPLSFKLLGQRFIIDSYVFSNVVFDRITYQGAKVWRPMPDPLDAMFVLGNDDALPLLEEELETFHYSGELAALRYLVDAFDETFWTASLYNVWLEAIRSLNPPEERAPLPLFMQGVAWHQQKLNTQLASWSHLRHDNLLYAKQSYTAGLICSFPHTYVEPYPEFYRQITGFASMASTYFSQYESDKRYLLDRISAYFDHLGEVTRVLETLAQKELDGEAFTDEEKDFLKRMLFENAGSGGLDFTGWYVDLFYTPDDAAKDDFVIADVHTQPTDEFGTPVGRILHVGVGNVNLGVFLASSASCGFKPMAFVGPVLSYYETVTGGFDRLTDERWAERVRGGNVPVRPDWVNVFLADRSGNRLPRGRELPGVIYTASTEEAPLSVPTRFVLHQNFPNPFNTATTIRYELPRAGQVALTLYDVSGREVATPVKGWKEAGRYRVTWDAGDFPSGIYFYRLNVRVDSPSKGGTYVKTRKLLVIK